MYSLVMVHANKNFVDNIRHEEYVDVLVGKKMMR